MQQFWNDESISSISEKEFFCELILNALNEQYLNKKQLIDLCFLNGMTADKKEYLFNSWGGIPRYLVETGKIIIMCDDHNTYMPAPDVILMNQEDAEKEQLKRYLEGYSPCTIEDVMYFFKWGKRKSQILIEQVLRTYFINKSSMINCKTYNNIPE
ncbi:MAG: hypothetical protein NC392_03280 [Roseburia sp.]|nr:hypothetical protein [Roseburia sp.]